MKHFTYDDKTTLCGIERPLEHCMGPVDCPVCLDLWGGKLTVNPLMPRHEMPWPCR